MGGAYQEERPAVAKALKWEKAQGLQSRELREGFLWLEKRVFHPTLG